MISLMEVSNNTPAPVEKSNNLQHWSFHYCTSYILMCKHWKDTSFHHPNPVGLVRGTLHHWERVPHIFTFDFRYLHFSSHPSSFPSFPPHRHFGNLGIPAWATSEDVHIRWTDWTFHIFCQASTSQKSVNRAAEAAATHQRLCCSWCLVPHCRGLFPEILSTRYELNLSGGAFQPRQAHSANELMNEIYKLYAAVYFWCFPFQHQKLVAPATPVAQKQLESLVHQ